LKNTYSFDFEPKNSFLPKLEIKFALVDQLIYMDASRQFTQDNRILKHLHIRVQENLTLKRWNSHHELNLHNLSPDPAGWTGWYTYHDLSYKASFFKRATYATFGVNAQVIGRVEAGEKKELMIQTAGGATLQYWFIKIACSGVIPLNAKQMLQAYQQGK